MSKLDIPLDGRQAFIGGQWVVLDGCGSIPVISPADESHLGEIAACTAAHVDQAVAAIRPALDGWKALSVAQRTKYLERYARAIAAHEDELADYDVRDAGMTRSKALADVRRSVRWIGEYCAYALDLTGRQFPSSGDTLVYTAREPYGIVGQIIPFNHPENFAVKAIAPAVLTGNAVLAKPPEQASLSALALAELARDIFPPGIVNVLTGHGHEVGAAIVAHPAIPRINFTGSVPTGRRILEGAAHGIKHVTLELGGKNPLILTGGLDPEFAAKLALKNMNLTHAGQSCQSSTRVLVHRSIYGDVVERLAGLMAQVVVGDPGDPATQMGPLGFGGHFVRVMDYVRIGKAEGATLRFGGVRPDGMDKGYYVLPTLFSDVTPDMQIARDEIFGPVVCLIPWDTEDEVVAIANDTDMGLNCRVFAPTVEEGLRIGKRIESGLCYVNTSAPLDPGVPNGGFKQSGFGKRNCAEEVLSYTRERTYAVGIG
ncbi:aldehyde dehydrogenase family protein [Salipiger sp.]|uniref:aldehyde dehydrogenase family protein n=1 Tax=Salipiger sp. TaxID=2078585 RepID=UPI003A96E933